MTRVESKGLSKRQQDVLNFVQQFIQDMGCPPTVREIARHFGFASPRSVQLHLESLTKKGALSYRSAGSRGRYRLARGLRLSPGLTGFPLLGRVPAGTPAWQANDVEDTVSLKEMFPQAPNVFALRVKGDSMNQAGILDGDTVLVRAQSTAEPHDIVVALVDGEATVKRFTRKQGDSFLTPANPKYEPIPVTSQVQISGKVIGVLRKYNQ